MRQRFLVDFGFLRPPRLTLDVAVCSKSQAPRIMLGGGRERASRRVDRAQECHIVSYTHTRVKPLRCTAKNVFCGRFDMLLGAKGGARGSWWFPVIGRVRLRVCQALVRPDRVEGAIATTLMCGAARAAPGGPTHFHAL